MSLHVDGTISDKDTALPASTGEFRARTVLAQVDMKTVDWTDMSQPAFDIENEDDEATPTTNGYTKHWFLNRYRPVWEQIFSETHCKVYEDPCAASAEVFPFLRRANFTRLPHNVLKERHPIAWFQNSEIISAVWYDHFLPALVLLCRLIRVTPRFWTSIGFGKLVLDEDGKWTCSAYDRSDNADKCHAMFESIRNIQCCSGRFVPVDDDEAPYAKCEGGVLPTFCAPGVATVRMRLSHHFMAFFADPAFDHQPRDLRDRMRLVLAVTIVHELAHAWWHYRAFEYARMGNVELWNALFSGEEPRFTGSDVFEELGNSWERYALDGYVGFATEEWTKALDLHVDDLSGSAAPWWHTTRVPHAELVRAFLNDDCWTALTKSHMDDTEQDNFESLKLLEKMAAVVSARSGTSVSELIKKWSETEKFW